MLAKKHDHLQQKMYMQKQKIFFVNSPVLNNNKNEKQNFYDAGQQQLIKKSMVINQQLQNKYSPQFEPLNKCLPAKFCHHPIYGQLLLSFQQIILHSNMAMSKAKNIIYRCRMLGYLNQQLPYAAKDLIYTIHTKNKLFKHYLKDMRISVIQVLDARNYQPIGHAYLNWLTYLRSVEDNQPIVVEKQKNKYSRNQDRNHKVGYYSPSKRVDSDQNQAQMKYYLPFFDELCEITLPVFDYRHQKMFQTTTNNRSKSKENGNNLSDKIIQNQKMNSKQRTIGELRIKFSSRIYQQPIAAGYEVACNNPSNLIAANMIPTSDDHNSNHRLTIQHKIQPNQRRSFINANGLLIPSPNNLKNYNPNKNNKIISANTIQSLQNNNQYTKHGQIQQLQVPNNNNKNLILQRQHSNFSTQNQEKVNLNNKFLHHRKGGLNNNLFQHHQQFSYGNNRNSNDRESESKYLHGEKRYGTSPSHEGGMALKSRTNQLQLLQLKMDIQDFFKPSSQSQFHPKDHSKDKQILQIVKIKSRLSNITQLDIYLGQLQQRQSNTQNLHQTNQNLNNRPHIKIFKISNPPNPNQKPKININEDFFNSKIIVQRAMERYLQIVLPNSLGKCTFRCKDIVSGTSQFFVYNKGNIVGSVFVKKEAVFQNRNKFQEPNVIKEQSAGNNKKITEAKSLQKMKNTGEVPRQQIICIITISNFKQYFVKSKSTRDQRASQAVQSLDHYSLNIKSLQILYQSLLNQCKQSYTGQYFIIKSINIPNLFNIQVKNSQKQLVGKSQNITYQGNNIQIQQKNIMPILVVETNISINLKNMPVFKKLPSNISFKLGMYVANTSQLNYFISKWKQNKVRMMVQQNNMIGYVPRNEYSYNNQKQYDHRHKPSNIDFPNKKSIDLNSIERSKTNKSPAHIKTQTELDQYLLSKKYNNRNNFHNRQKSISQSKQSRMNERYKTQGNYTQDLHSQFKQKRENKKNSIHSGSEKLHTQQVSLGGRNEEGVEGAGEEIYLVEFFCKSLHFVLGKLGSIKNIENKLNQMRSLYNNEPKQTINSQSRYKSQQNFSVKNSHTIPKQQFQAILSQLIGQLNQPLLDFDILQILQALFSFQNDQGQIMIKFQQFTLCLMAYYNFLLLLATQKVASLKELIACQPKVENKLTRIKQSMTNINSQFLWNDVLPNVIQKTKQKINKKYRISPNVPFSIHNLLKDLTLVGKPEESSGAQGRLINQLLKVMFVQDDKFHDNFMNLTGQMACLVRQTVQQIILGQNASKVQQQQHSSPSWLQRTYAKIQQFIKKQKTIQNESSPQPNKEAELFMFNLTQFQQFFSLINIQTSLWQSLMLIQQIKIWYQNYDINIATSNYIENGGEGIISQKLLKSWFNSLNFIMEIKNNKSRVFSEKEKKDNRIVESRVKSVKSAIDEDQEDIIQQMNEKNRKEKEKVVVKQEKVTESIFNFNKKPESRPTPKASLKQSQTFNNQSDIANIANLLKQNENNLFFLPSFTQAGKTNNKLTLQNIKSNQHILKGLQQNTMFMNDGPMTLSMNPKDIKKNNILNQISGPRQKPIIQNNEKSSKNINLRNLNPNNDQSQYISSSQASQQLQHLKQNNYIQIKQKLQPQQCYLSIKLKQIKLYTPQSITQLQGLKKLVISINKKSGEEKEISSLENNNKKETSYNYLTKELMEKLFGQENNYQQKQNNQIQKQLSNKFCLDNFCIDANRLNEFQSQYKNGVNIQVVNLVEKGKQKNGNQKSREGNRRILMEGKNQEVILNGILPIEEVVKMVQDYKKEVGKENKNEEEKQLIKVGDVSKRKTIVLYSHSSTISKNKASHNNTIDNNQNNQSSLSVLRSKQQKSLQKRKPLKPSENSATSHRKIAGKIIVQINISATKTQQNTEKNNLSSDNKYQKDQKYQTIQIQYKINKNYNNGSIKKKTKKQTLNLFYCSVRQQQTHNRNLFVQLIPKMTQSQKYEINIPEPIIEYQLMLKTLAQQDQKDVDYKEFYNNNSRRLQGSYYGSNDISQSRYSNFNNLSSAKVHNSEALSSFQECIIPLQTLFFKKQVNDEEYPMINLQSGRFLCSVGVKMKILEDGK